MIELVSRKSVFHNLPKTGNEIYLIQKSLYDDNFSDTNYPLTEKQIIELELEFDFIEAKPVEYYDFELIRIKSKDILKMVILSITETLPMIYMTCF
jgi:hypothetical protein